MKITSFLRFQAMETVTESSNSSNSAVTNIVSKLCESCRDYGDDIEATAFCETCSKHICEGHHILHRASPRTKDHAVVVRNPFHGWQQLLAKLPPNQILKETDVRCDEKLGGGCFGRAYKGVVLLSSQPQAVCFKVR